MGALPAVNDPHAARIWAFVSRSTSAYTLVVSIETWPSHARIVVELGLADRQDRFREVHVRPLQGERLADTKSGAVEQQ